MSIWETLLRLRFAQLLHLMFIALRYPLFVYPTLKATTVSYQTAKKYFPKTHSKSGKGNAFRHALWNMLICFECIKWKGDKERVLAWARLITEEHERLYPNEALSREMDLHNNRIGRELFEAADFENLETIIRDLQMKLESVKIIKVPGDSKYYEHELVIINDEG